MPTNAPASRARLGRTLETILLVPMAFIGLHLALLVTGDYGLGIRPYTNVTGADFIMSVRAEPDFAIDLSDRFEWIDTENGTRDAATGLEPVDLSGPIELSVNFWSPTMSQRVAWLIGETVGPLLTLAGLWTLRRIISSARIGNPFTAANERRLWQLAAIVAIGGTVATLVTGFTEMLLIQRSAAADVLHTTTTVSSTPLFGGLVLAMLALVWRLGIQMQDDLEGTI